MRKYIINIVFFFGIVLAVDFAFGLLGDHLQSHAKSGYTRRINDFVVKDKHDIVVFGSSRAHHHYDTPYLKDTLGMDVYNAGYDGYGIVHAYGLLGLMLDRYDPKLIIYDVEPAFDIKVHYPDNNNKRYIGYLKPYFRNPIIEGIIREISLEEWYKVHFGLLRYNSRIISLVMDNLRTVDDRLFGYEPLKGIYEGSADSVKENIVLDSLKMNYFNMFLQAANSHKIPLIVVASPKLGVANSDVLNPVKQLCRDNNVPFYDYYAEDSFQNPYYFKEPTHLNAAGARCFSSSIARLLLENNILISYE